MAPIIITSSRAIRRPLAQAGGGSNGYDPAPTPNGSDLYVDITNGNDANPGTLASPKQHASAITWSALTAGQAVWFRTGTYTWPDIRDLSTNGTSSQRITISAYPGESVTLSFTDAAAPNLCSGNYVDFRKFNIQCENFGFQLSGTNPGTGGGAATSNIRFIDLTGNRSSQSFTDNSGIILIGAASVDFIEVVRCDFTVSGTGSGNQAAIWADTTKHLKIIGCRLNGAAAPFYYKHNHQDTQANTSLIFKNNLVKMNTGGRGALFCADYFTISNNVFYDTGMVFSDDGGNPGGDFNTISNNTMFGAAYIEMNPPQSPTTASGGGSLSISTTNASTTAQLVVPGTGPSPAAVQWVVGQKFVISGASSAQTHPSTSELNSAPNGGAPTNIFTVTAVSGTATTGFSYSFTIPVAASATASNIASGLGVTSDLVVGAFGNMLRNNIMSGSTAYWDNRYNAVSGLDQLTDTDYNTFTSGAAVIWRNSTSYSLSGYVTAFSTKENHSQAGTITYNVGSPTIATLTDWSLNSGSTGHLAGNDGKDTGVNAANLMTVN